MRWGTRQRSATVGRFTGTTLVAVVAAGIAALLAAGCSQLPPTHYYVLELDPAAAASTGGGTVADPSGWTIGVRPFAVDSPYDQDRIVYRVGEGSAEVGFYAYHLWAAPLSSMLAAAVATGLEGAAGISVIEPVAAGRAYRAFLNGRVLAVEEIDLADRQRVRAEVELRLVGPDGAELWSDVLTARGETSTEQVGEVVEALSAALAEALAGTRESLAVALSGRER
jgi:uncharacterized lipoprotein YmbA